uniref:Uncharacterized protein n=1 Tax=viral metagenome TaxID=1070528 RepID=A0A6C0CTD9_9ZZZZ
MDWTLYPDLYEFVKYLPKQKQSTSIQESEKWQQCKIYDIRHHPVKKVERLFLPMIKQINDITTMSYNESLWMLLCRWIDSDHHLTSRSYQKENVHFLIQQLKTFMVQPEVRKVFTGRKMYPILEMLDKSVTEFTKAHHHACGFLFAFLLNCPITMEGEMFQHHPDTDKALVLSRNSKGQWFEVLDKN